MTQLKLEFSELKGEYVNAKTEGNEEEKKKAFDAMKANLAERIKESDDDLLKAVDINNITIEEELYRIAGELRKQTQQKENSEVGNAQREKLISLNKYSKNNPYGGF